MRPASLDTRPLRPAADGESPAELSMPSGSLWHSLSLCSLPLALSSLRAAAMASSGAPMDAARYPSPVRLTPDAASTALPSFASS